MTIQQLQVFDFSINEQDYQNLSLTGKCRLLIKRTTEACVFYDLKGYKGIIDTRTKTRAGQCNYRRKTVSVSTWLVEHNTLEEVINTITHEIAHAISYVFFEHAGHGFIWKNIHIKIGGDGQRCYTSNQVNNPYIEQRKKGMDLNDSPISHLIEKQIGLYNKVFKITGFVPSRHKFPVLMTDVNTQKRWKAPLRDVLNAKVIGTQSLPIIENPIIEISNLVTVSSVANREWNAFATKHSLPVDMIGKKVSYKNSVYTINGLNKNSNVFPILATTDRGTKYKLRVSDLKVFLGK